jgi:hypothetical protein
VVLIVLNNFAAANTAAVGSLLPPADRCAGSQCHRHFNVKGPETIKAVVDWAGNPHNGPGSSAYARRTGSPVLLVPPPT